MIHAKVNLYQKWYALDERRKCAFCGLQRRKRTFSFDEGITNCQTYVLQYYLQYSQFF